MLFRLTGVLFNLNNKTLLTAGHLVYLKPLPAGGHLDTSSFILSQGKFIF